MKTIEERAQEYSQGFQYDWILKKGYVAGAYAQDELISNDSKWRELNMQEVANTVLGNEIYVAQLNKKDAEIAQLAQFLKERITRDALYQKIMEEMGEALDRGINRIQSAYVNGTFPNEEYVKEFKTTEEEMRKALEAYDKCS